MNPAFAILGFGYAASLLFVIHQFRRAPELEEPASPEDEQPCTGKVHAIRLSPECNCRRCRVRHSHIGQRATVRRMRLRGRHTFPERTAVTLRATQPAQ